MKSHLKDLLQMERQKAPPLFTSVCATETDSGNDDDLENEPHPSGANTLTQPAILESNFENGRQRGTADDPKGQAMNNLATSTAPPSSSGLDGSFETLASTGVPRVKRKIKKAKLISPAWREGSRAAADLLSQRKLEVANEGDVVELIVRQVRYSQDSIRGIFRDGRPIMQMRRELFEGKKSLASIPTITAVVHDGQV